MKDSELDDIDDFFGNAPRYPDGEALLISILFRLA